jgi:hypothetical protein
VKTPQGYVINARARARTHTHTRRQSCYITIVYSSKRVRIFYKLNNDVCREQRKAITSKKSDKLLMVVTKNPVQSIGWLDRKLCQSSQSIHDVDPTRTTVVNSCLVQVTCGNCSLQLHTLPAWKEQWLFFF